MRSFYGHAELPVRFGVFFPLVWILHFFSVRSFGLAELPEGLDFCILWIRFSILSFLQVQLELDLEQLLLLIILGRTPVSFGYHAQVHLAREQLACQHKKPIMAHVRPGIKFEPGNMAILLALFSSVSGLKILLHISSVNFSILFACMEYQVRFPYCKEGGGDEVTYGYLMFSVQFCTVFPTPR